MWSFLSGVLGGIVVIGCAPTVKKFSGSLRPAAVKAAKGTIAVKERLRLDLEPLREELKGIMEEARKAREKEKKEKVARPEKVDEMLKELDEHLKMIDKKLDEE